LANAHRYVLQIIFGTLLPLAISACGTQPMTRSFSDLDQRLKPGNIISIINHDGVIKKQKSERWRLKHHWLM